MWYIIYNGQQVGPLSKNDLLNYGLTPDSMVWANGMPDWTRAGSCPDLADLFAAPNPGYGNNAAPGYSVPPQQPYAPYGCKPTPYPDKSKIAAGLLAIFLGGLGIHYFYLGKTSAGLICLLLTLCSCGVWEFLTFAQGIYMLCISDEEFYQKYVYTTKTFPLF